MAHTDQALELVVNNLKEVVYRTDAEGRWTYLNSAWVRHTGHSIEASLGRKFLEFVHPDDRDRGQARFLALMAGELEEAHGEIRYLKNGGVCDFDAYVRPIIDANGQIIGTVGTLDEITERKEAQAAQVRRGRYVDAINHVQQELLGWEAGDERMGNVTQLLRAASGACRVNFFVLRDSKWRIEAQACRDELTLPVSELQDDVGFDFPPGWVELLAANQNIVGVREEFSSEEQITLEATGCLATLLVPLQVNGGLYGAIGFSNTLEPRPWTDLEIALLASVAKATSLALERHASAEALRASESKFRQLAEHIQEVFWISDPHDKRILYVSPAYEEIWGLGREDLYADARHFLGAVHPEDRARVSKAVDLRLEVAYDQEYRVIRPDGSMRWIRDRAFPVYGEDGTISRITGIATDITDVKLAELEMATFAETLERHVEERTQELERTTRELKRSQTRYRTLFQDSLDAVCLLDPEGTILEANKAMAEITGYSDEELVGANMMPLFHESEHERSVQMRAQVLTNGPQRAEFHCLKRNRESIYIDIVSTVLEVDNEKLILAMAHDITEQRAAEVALKESQEQLRHAQRMEAVGQLAGGVAHDFNNVLAVVTSYADFLKRALEPESPLQEDVREIRDAASRGASLTSQLLTFSRKQVLRFATLEINDAVQGMHNLLERLIGADIEIRVDLEERLGHAFMDRGQFEQVIMNLVVNARDAMPDGGQLGIETFSARVDDQSLLLRKGLVAGDYVGLRVTDTGVGMDMETQSRMFEPFFTTKSRSKGTGLGLSTVYGIVKQSDGVIDISSTPGEGTIITIYFPRAVIGTEVEVEAEPGPVSEPGYGTILVAEDDLQVRKLVRRILEEAGYNVMIARDGEDALAILERSRGRVDMLLSDVVMPKIGGNELARRAVAQVPGLPVLFMTGYLDDVGHEAGLAAKSDVVLQKPFTAASLTSKVREVLLANAVAGKT